MAATFRPRENATIPITPVTEEDRATSSAESTPNEEPQEKEAPAITFTASDEVKVAPQRDVKIRMSVSHVCSIGGKRYSLEKGKTYNVPENVKSILLRAGLLLPL